MLPYLDKDGDSGIVAYEINPHSIIVKFHDQWCYEYSSQSVGAAHLQQMKTLAQQGDGLNAYINHFVKTAYTRKFRC
jgi:hypothetical protein